MAADPQTEQRTELQRALALEAVFDAFEAELQRGQAPQIESLVKRLPPDAEREALLEFARIAAEYATRSAPRPSTSNPVPPDAALQSAAGTQSTASGETKTDGFANGGSAIAPLVGTFGEYEIEEQIGSGGMGTVYRSRQTRVGRTVALKVLNHHSSAISDEGAKRRFLREIAAASRQVHENIVTVFDAGDCDGRQFVAMQYVEGQSLRQLVGDAPLANRRAAGYLLPVCRAVEAMHDSGVLHRDLKPSNILVDSANDRPLVADFGLAKLVDEDGEYTRSGEMFGSPPYMPPEQYIDARAVNRTADVYGLGATLYHLLTGRPPFQAATLTETIQQVVARRPVAPRLLNTAVDRDLETICLKCLEKEPQRRYATAALLAADLERYLKGQAILARPPGAVERLTRWGRQNRLTATLLIGVFLSLLAVVGVSSTMYVRELQTARDLREANDEGRRQLSFRCVATAALDQSDQLGRAIPWLAESLTLDRSDEARRLADRRRIDLTLAQYPTLTRQHWNDEISRLLIDQAGQTIVTTDTAQSFVVRDVETWRQRSRFEFPGRVIGAALSSDGELLAITGQDSAIALVDTATGEPKDVTWRSPEKSYAYPQFLPNSQRLLTHGSIDGVVRIWDYRQNTTSPTLELKHNDRVTSYDVSADGKTIATGSADGQIRLWNAVTGEPLSESLRTTGGIHVLRISADGKFVLTFSALKKGLLWDVLKQPASYEEWTVDTPVQDARFAPDGQTCWIADRLGVLHQRHVSDRKELLTIPSAGPIRRMEIDANGARLMTVHEGKIVRILDARTGMALTPPILHDRDVFYGRLISDDRFATAMADGCIRLWRHTHPTRQLRPNDTHTSRTVKEGVVSPNKDWMAILRINYTVDMFNLKTQQETPRPMTLRRDVYAVRWSPDGNWLATGHRDGTLQLWNVITGEMTGVRKSIPGQPLVSGGDSQGISQMTWSPDGKYLVTATRDGLLRVWNSAGEQVHEKNILPANQQNGLPGPIEFDSSGRRFLVAFDKQVFVCDIDRFDAADSVLSYTIQRRQQLTTFLDDKRILIVDLLGNNATIWHCGADIPDETFPTSIACNHAILDKTNLRLATCGSDRVLTVTELSPTPRVVVSVQMHERLADMKFSGNGAQLNLLQEDGWMASWDASTGEPLSPPIEMGEEPFALLPDDASSNILALFKLGEVIEARAAQSKQSDDDLANWCRLVAGHRADPLQGLIPLTREESIRLWEEHLARSGSP